MPIWQGFSENYDQIEVKLKLKWRVPLHRSHWQSVWFQKTNNYVDFRLSNSETSYMLFASVSLKKVTFWSKVSFDQDIHSVSVWTKMLGASRSHFGGGASSVFVQMYLLCCLQWIRASQIRVSQIRASQIRASQIRATEIYSNHRKLHGAIFFVHRNLHIIFTWGQSLGINFGFQEIVQDRYLAKFLVSFRLQVFRYKKT